MKPGTIGGRRLRLAGTRGARAAVLGVAGTAAAAAIVGLAVPAGATPVTAQRAGAGWGTEHFQLMTTSGTATTIPVIAWGVFTAAGVDNEGNSNTNTATDVLAFANGSFEVTHTDGAMKQTFNPKTCLLQVSGPATLKIGGGTGAYRRIRGQGTATLTLVLIAARTSSGACDQNANPVAFQQVIAATARIRLP